MPITRWWKRAKKPERRVREWIKIWKMISRLQKALCVAQALQTDWMWPPVDRRPRMRFSIKNWLSTFPRNWGFWCDYRARGAAQRVCCTSWIHKTVYFWKAERQGFGIRSWSSLSPAHFLAQPFPKFRPVLSIRKNFLFKANWGSFQSYTIKVPHAGCFTRLWNPLLFVGCATFMLDDFIRWFIQGHFWILCLDFETCNSFIVIWRNIVPSCV